MFPLKAAVEHIRYHRRRIMPALPESLHELGELVRNFIAEKFLCHGGILKDVLNTGNGCSAVFYCQNTVDAILNEGVTEMHADATFKVVPFNPRTSQLFILHVISENYVSIVHPFLYIQRCFSSNEHYTSIYKTRPNLTHNTM